MKTKLLILAGITLIAVAVALVAMKSSDQSHHRASSSAEQAGHNWSQSNASHQSQKRVPKFYETPPATLPPTLAPERFTGKTQAAYHAVREIPKTIAQLPCYCYCDEGHGHKSLHSCYEDEHAGSCVVCVEEVLLAYRLEKERGLSPSQIRQVIIERYSTNN